MNKGCFDHPVTSGSGVYAISRKLEIGYAETLLLRYLLGKELSKKFLHCMGLYVGQTSNPLDVQYVGRIPEKRSANRQQRYLELVAFYQHFHHTDVPQIYPTNPPSGWWVNNRQCKEDLNGKLTAERN